MSPLRRQNLREEPGALAAHAGIPACNSEAMQLHLDEIATKVEPGAHAILILDQAGWHGAKQLRIPANISLLPLPPRAPELNSQENIWQFMRQNWLSNRDLQIFRRHRRPLLLRLEHSHRPTMEDHVHRVTRLGGRRSVIVRVGISRLSVCYGDKKKNPLQVPMLYLTPRRHVPAF
jgi:hypothetical protein